MNFGKLSSAAADMAGDALKSGEVPDVSKLNKKDLANLAESEVGKLGGGDLEKLDPKALGGIMDKLNANQLGAVKPDVLKNMAPAALQKLNPAALQGMTGDQLGSADGFLKKLNPTQLENLSGGQVGSLKKAALEKLNPSQLSAIQSKLLPDNMPLAALKNISPADFASKFSASNVAGMDKTALAAVVSKMGASQIAGAKPEGLMALAPAALQKLPLGAVSGLSAAQLMGGAAGGEKGSLLPKMSIDQLKALAPAALGSMPKPAIDALAPSKLDAIKAMLPEGLAPAGGSGGGGPFSALTSIPGLGPVLGKVGGLGKAGAGATGNGLNKVGGLMAAMPLLGGPLAKIGNGAKGGASSGLGALTGLFGKK